MNVELKIVDTETDAVLQNLGYVTTDSVNRAIDLYSDELTEWCDRGYLADITYRIVE